MSRADSLNSWYNDSDYSDLTLKLKDDREIKVHKVVICKSNEFFRGLCGVGSSFAVCAYHDESDIANRTDNDTCRKALKRPFHSQMTIPMSSRKSFAGSTAAHSCNGLKSHGSFGPASS